MTVPTPYGSESDRFLSRSQVAEIFSVSPSTVTRWADDGKLPYIRTLGGHRRYVKESILRLTDTYPREEWMESLIVEIPGMYGDHHAASVHQSVSALPGVQEVWASAAFRRLTVSYDPERIGRQAILEQLTLSGYAIANGHPEVTSPQVAQETALSRSSLRMTQTHSADRT